MSNDHTTRFVVKGASTHRARLFHARALAIVFSLSRCLSLYLSLSIYIYVYINTSLYLYTTIDTYIYIHRCMYACVSNVRMIQGFSKINAHRITTYVYTHAHGSSNMFQDCRARSAIMLTMFHCLSDLPEGGRTSDVHSRADGTMSSRTLAYASELAWAICLPALAV